MPGANRRAVLVAVDEPTVRERIAAVLGAEGLAVVEARGEAEAIPLLNRLSPPKAHLCAILLEIMLPKVGGLEVLRHLATRRVDVPVVALSASRPLLAEAMLAGAACALAKPSSISELVSRATGTVAEASRIAEVLSVVARHCSHAHD